MRLGKMIHAVDLHACGEPGRVIVGGVLDVPGASVFEKMAYLREHRDDVRKRMLREPRGYPAANCNLIVPPCHPEADAGFVIMEQVEYPGMSGTNTICVVTTLIETGMVPAVETLLCTPAVRNLIREARTFEIPNVIETNRAIGMSSLDSSIAELYFNGMISKEDAIAQAAFPDKLERQLAA